jgi:carbon storage regulator
MLVLSRRPGEEIIINGNIRISIVSMKGDRIRIGVEAPKSVSVDRAEVHSRREGFIEGLCELPVGAAMDETGFHPKTIALPKAAAVLA